ncbi:hypothetical protein KOR34_25160 [Posidoniimonas corsicana]|uniref:Planctomycete cytochrome C n=1 Tax=Posidoniimonas corsicana TaxID=1938618 RepID=A0A5C5VHT0_9BACT|nr:DUF1592 domain-containing protein [Posidoniimonas corsicana]TWT37563.1 hypothetical protein KOR34_25160 [Posidoniimonas corsicana]
MILSRPLYDLLVRGAAPLVLALTAIVGAATAESPRLPVPDAATLPNAERVLPFVEEHCLDCHSEGYAEAGVMLDHFGEVGQILSDRNAWQRVLKQVRAGAMPPDGSSAVAKEDRAAFVEQLGALLEYVDPTKPVDPGRVTARRLNKHEYDNTIRDLFGLELRLSHAFPDDDAGYGFDNNGDVLSLSPLHLEQYLGAAEELTAALFKVAGSKHTERILFDHLLTDGDTDGVDGARLMRPGATAVTTIEVPAPGRYRVACEAWRHDAQEGDRHAAVRIDCGEQSVGVFVPEATSPDRGRKDRVGGELTLAAGEHTIRIEYAIPEPRDGEELSAADLKPIAIGTTIARRIGDAPPESWPTAGRALLFDRPADGEAPEAAVRRVTEAVLSRCWRRAASPEEVDAYAGFALDRLADGAPFEDAASSLVQAVLVSPQFLFRVDLLPPEPQQAEHAVVADSALASRLSYFLWCSAPDDELLGLANEAKLSADATLTEQIARLLADPRSERFIESFFGQWLGLRKLEGLPIDTTVFRRVSSQLKEDMQTETLMLAESIAREDQSLLQLITADYTFINRSLARLYGIDGVRGNAFRRVELEGLPRRGMLTHASVLTLTSYPNRTSPPRRGAWVLENLLGDEPPAPPADVPELAETQANSPDLPLREQLALHLTDATCASCHEVMDPIGFGLENYNAIGQWRDKDKGAPIDAAGDLPSGESFGNALELIEILRQRDQAFAECVTRKMLTFALGRGLEHYDRIAVDDIVRSIKEDDYRFSQLVREVVLSRPFRLHRVDPAGADQPPQDSKEPS